MPFLTCQHHPLRIQRYVGQIKKGKVKASPELVKHWGTESGRVMVALGHMSLNNAYNLA